MSNLLKNVEISLLTHFAHIFDE